MSHLFFHHGDGDEDQVVYGVPEHYIGSILPTAAAHNFNDDDHDDGYDWRRNESQGDTEEDVMSYLEVDSAYWRKKRRVSSNSTGKADSDANTADRERIAMQGVFSMFAKYEQAHHQQQPFSQSLSANSRQVSQHESRPWEAASMASTLPSQQTNASSTLPTTSVTRVGATIDSVDLPVMSGIGPTSRNPFTILDSPLQDPQAVPIHYGNDLDTSYVDGIAALTEQMDSTFEVDMSLAIINPRKNLDFGSSPGPLKKHQSLSGAGVRFHAIPSMNPLPRRPMDPSHTPRNLNRQVVMDSTNQQFGEVLDLDRPAHWVSARKSLPPSSSAKKKLFATPKTDVNGTSTGPSTVPSSAKRARISTVSMEVPLPKSTSKASSTQAGSGKSITFTPSWIKRPRPSQSPSGFAGPSGNNDSQMIASNNYAAHAVDDIVEDQMTSMDSASSHIPGSLMLSSDHQRAGHVVNRSITMMTIHEDQYNIPSSNASGQFTGANISPSGKSKQKGSSVAKKSLQWRLQKLIREEEDAKVVLSELSKDPNNRTMQHLHPKNKTKLILTVEITDPLSELDNFTVFKVRILQRICRGSRVNPTTAAASAADKVANFHESFRLPENFDEHREPIALSSSFLQDDMENDEHTEDLFALLLFSKHSQQEHINTLTSYQHLILYEPEELSCKIFTDVFLPIAKILAKDSSLTKIILGSTLWETIV